MLAGTKADGAAEPAVTTAEAVRTPRFCPLFFDSVSLLAAGRFSNQRNGCSTAGCVRGRAWLGWELARLGQSELHPPPFAPCLPLLCIFHYRCGGCDLLRACLYRWL